MIYDVLIWELSEAGVQIVLLLHGTRPSVASATGLDAKLR